MASDNVVHIKANVLGKIARKVRLQALGNSHRTLRDVCVDLINASNESHATIATGCFLCTKTIENLAEDITQHPREDTMKRIFIYFGMEINFRQVQIKAEYWNKAKE